MSRLLARLSGIFGSRNLVGVDKAGNRYFTRKEEVDGILKEKRWVIFKGEEDPTSIPVEWICWLSGQRKRAPTPEEMIELEAKRDRIRLNVALLKKEEEERKAKGGSFHQGKGTGKAQGPDLKSFIQQFPDASFDDNKGKGPEEVPGATNDTSDANKARTSEPTGSGSSFKPGTWQPPT
ncbi:hypothetical protein QJS04_geneDACA018029 [Acorus gramineus]|uniref:NADH dehydrogenase [ubiquinone] 1 alpha subcomplex subunit 12 n=1 Tax=Acorus gramineus TaxID=55184 RepID=A0AAV9AAF2_ACOGR|nr:hypothetical protein QJS04_geneDACA018029 [Acorus gramineus]